MKIAYLEHSGLGNAVLSTPTLQAIKIAHPDSELTVCTWPRSGRAYEGLDFINRVEIDHPTNVLATIGPVDYVLISPVGAITSPDLPRFARKIVAAPVKAPWIRHESEYKLDLARKIGFQGEAPQPKFTLFGKNIENALNFMDENKLELKKFFCLNASYLRTDHWHLKHWGNENYARLLYLIQRDYPDFKIILLGTHQDKDDAAFIRFAPSCWSEYPYCENKSKIACGWSEDVGDTAALINMSAGIVGNDSGLAHIAAALDVPTLTIFTFTNILKNSPLGDKAKIIFHPCDLRISCQHGNWERCQEKSCFSIPPEEVLTEIKKLFFLQSLGR